MITNQQSRRATTGPTPRCVSGKDITALMDQQDFSGFPFPAMPAEARVALLLAKYAVLGMVPLIIPSVLIDVPIPTDQSPASRAPIWPTSRPRRAGGLRLLHRSRAGARDDMAYWGPQIKVGTSAARAEHRLGRAHQRRVAAFRFDSEKNKIPTVFIYNELTKVSSRSRFPPITPLNPPLGLIPPLPTSLRPT